MSSALSKDIFSEHEGSAFSVYLDESNVADLTLVEVADQSNDQVDGFTLLFKAELDTAFGNDIHNIKHKKVGDFQLALGRVLGPDDDGNYYEAVFTQLKDA